MCGGVPKLTCGGRGATCERFLWGLRWIPPWGQEPCGDSATCGGRGTACEPCHWDFRRSSL
eukprot:3002927-Pyramimonas_sp.AAC.1